MKARILALTTTCALLALAYAYFFTEWIRPAPIEISSQIRVSVLQPRFGRPVGPKKLVQTNLPVVPTEPGGPDHVLVKTNLVVRDLNPQRVRLPNWGTIEDAPGGAANVTFTLDTEYRLTTLRVQDVPTDGSAPKTVWELTGESNPVRSLLYGRVPEGMRPTKPDAKPEPLTPGAPYRLYLEAGRRRGTNHFSTRPVAVPN